MQDRPALPALQELAEGLLAGEAEIARSAQRLTAEVLRVLADDPERAVKYLLAINAVRGTALDKLARAPARFPQSVVQVNIVYPGQEGQEALPMTANHLPPGSESQD